MGVRLFFRPLVTLRDAHEARLVNSEGAKKMALKPCDNGNDQTIAEHVVCVVVVSEQGVFIGDTHEAGGLSWRQQA